MTIPSRITELLLNFTNATKFSKVIKWKAISLTQTRAAEQGLGGYSPPEYC